MCMMTEAAVTHVCFVELEWWDGRTGRDVRDGVADALMRSGLLAGDGMRLLDDPSILEVVGGEFGEAAMWMLFRTVDVEPRTVKAAIVAGAGVRVKTIGRAPCRFERLPADDLFGWLFSDCAA